MEFGKEYKKAAQDISPDRAAIDRMKANVMAEVNKRKKPLPLGKIAISCGSVAACTAIVITAAVLIPHTDTSNMTAGTFDSSAAASEATSNEIGYDTAADADFDIEIDDNDNIAEDATADDKSYSNEITADTAVDTVPKPDYAAPTENEEIIEDVIEDGAADEEEIAEPDEDDIDLPNPTAGDDSGNYDGGKSDSVANVTADDETGETIDEVIDENICDDTADDDIADDAADDMWDDEVWDDTDDDIDTDGIDEDVPDNDIGDDMADDDVYDFDDSADYDDETDDSFDDADYDDATDDSFDDSDYDPYNDPANIKAKFSSDRNTLVLLLPDGTKLKYERSHGITHYPRYNTPYEYIYTSDNTGYMIQRRDEYLWTYTPQLDSEYKLIQ